MKSILVVEDDITLSDGITFALSSEEISIVQAYTMKEANANLTDGIDLIILDVNLPDGNGIQYLKEIRKQSNIPIIVLTANDRESDVVIGLESGANDYVTKPCSLAILRARVNAQLRMIQEPDTDDVVELDDFCFNFTKMEFKRKDEVIELSKTEQKLLYMLVKNKGQTLEKSTLVDRLWTDDAKYVDENVLSVTIKRLRGKLEKDASKPEYIKNVYGIGYVWVVKK